MKRLNEEIKTGQLKQAYLLCGEEAYLRRQYRDRLTAALMGDGDLMNLNRFEGKGINPGEVIDLAQTMPFFADRRVLVIENSGFFKRGGEALADYLAEPAQTVFFVFVEPEIDKRSRLYKAVVSKGRRTTRCWSAGCSSFLRRKEKKLPNGISTFSWKERGRIWRISVGRWRSLSVIVWGGM